MDSLVAFVDFLDSLLLSLLGLVVISLLAAIVWHTLVFIITDLLETALGKTRTRACAWWGRLLASVFLGLALVWGGLRLYLIVF